MTSKIENLKDLEFYSDYDALASILLGWSKKKDNEELDLCIKSCTGIAFYVNSLQMDRWGWKKAVSEYRQDKCRAVERARKAEALLDELKKENNKLKKLVNL